MLLAAPSPLWAAVEAIKNAPTPADNKPNDPSVPDAYAITGHFDRIVVMRMKFKTDVPHGMEKLVKQKHIQNGVILSGHRQPARLSRASDQQSGFSHQQHLHQ